MKQIKVLCVSTIVLVNTFGTAPIEASTSDRELNLLDIKKVFSVVADTAYKVRLTMTDPLSGALEIEDSPEMRELYFQQHIWLDSLSFNLTFFSSFAYCLVDLPISGPYYSVVAVPAKDGIPWLLMSDVAAKYVEDSLVSTTIPQLVRFLSYSTGTLSLPTSPDNLVSYGVSLLRLFSYNPGMLIKPLDSWQDIPSDYQKGGLQLDLDIDSLTFLKEISPPTGTSRNGLSCATFYLWTANRSVWKIVIECNPDNEIILRTFEIIGVFGHKFIKP